MFKMTVHISFQVEMGFSNSLCCCFRLIQPFLIDRSTVFIVYFVPSRSGARLFNHIDVYKSDKNCYALRLLTSVFVQKTNFTAAFPVALKEKRELKIANSLIGPPFLCAFRKQLAFHMPSASSSCSWSFLPGNIPWHFCFLARLDVLYPSSCIPSFPCIHRRARLSGLCPILSIGCFPLGLAVLWRLLFRDSCMMI